MTDNTRVGVARYGLFRHGDLTLGGSTPVHPKVIQVDVSCFGHKPKM